MPFENLKVFEEQKRQSKGSEQSSVHSTSNSVHAYPLWWNSSGSHVSHSSYSKNVNMNMDSVAQHTNQMKQLGYQIPDQDSSSTQSTGQSHQEEPGRGRSISHDQCVSSQSGYDTSEKQIEGNITSDLSIGTSDVLTPPKLDYNQSIACASYPYADPFYMNFLAAYGSHAMMNPQMVGMAPTSARVPLPIEPAVQEPIYVNAKQYHRILQRRQLRAKLEAQNKLTKDRKPYLHESRHLHALKRARGTGGRFLNTKQLQEQSQMAGTSGSATGPSNTSTFSDVTSISDSGGVFQQHHRRIFSADIRPRTEGVGSRMAGEVPSMGFQL